MVINVSMNNELDSVLNELENIGSDKGELDRLKKIIISLFDDNSNIELIINNLVDNIVSDTKKFYELKNKDDINYLTGFSASIYLPSIDNSGEVNILLTGGVGSRVNNDNKIDCDTLFDVASITKLFTLILTLKLSEDGQLISEGIFRKNSFYLINILTPGEPARVTLLEGCYDIMPYGFSFITEDGLSRDILTGSSTAIIDELKEDAFVEALDSIENFHGSYVKTK